MINIKTREKIYLECAFPRSNYKGILCHQEQFISVLDLELWFIKKGSEGCSIMDLYNELRKKSNENTPENKKVKQI